MWDDKGLLTTVATNPDDDTARLVYADWCEGHGTQLRCPRCNGTGMGEEAWVNDRVGDVIKGRLVCEKCRGLKWFPDTIAARAEFIRLQYELEKPEMQPVPVLVPIYSDETGMDTPIEHVVHGHTDPPARTESMNRCKTLFDAYSHEWWPDFNRPDVAFYLAGPMPVWGGLFQFGVRKGWPEVLWCQASAFVLPGFARWFVDLFPLKEVRLTDLQPSWHRKRSGGTSRVCVWWHPTAHDGGPRERNRRSTLPLGLCPHDKRRWNFKDESAAYRWLSDRCLEWARTAPPPKDDPVIHLPRSGR